MPVTAGQIAANTAKVTFSITITDENDETHEESVTVKYYPGRVTEKTIAQMQQFDTVDANNPDAVMEGFTTFNKELVKLIKSWDVLDDSVDPPVTFPLDPLRLAELPISFRMEVLNHIVSDIRPETVAPQAKTTPSSWN